MNLISATVGLIEILLILAAILFHKANQPNSNARNRLNGDARLSCGGGSVNIVQYRLHDLEEATDYFSDGNRLGKGAFGVVYKGRIDGEIVAIKLLRGSSVKLLEDIAKEVSLLSSLKHKNLVKLLGFCSEAGRYLLVYEYISNGDLRGCLIDNKKRETLNWEKRFKIIEGIAEGLSYLHHNSENVVIHRDLKPENILLDKPYTPKIADFGLSRVFETGKTHKSTRKLAGTLGYFAPELWFQWRYSTRSDVYSYGLLVLEILAGCTVPHYARANQEILSHAMWKQWKGKKPLAEVIDSCLHENCAMDQITRCCVIGLLCVQLDPKRRPGMELVLEMLHSNIDLPTPSFPGFFQEYEYARPPDSHSHEPVKYERPEDTRTSRLEPSFFQEYSLEDLMIVNSPETEEAYYALHGVSGSSGHFTAPSGRYLFTRSWVPLVSPPRALICMIHSFGDDTSWTMQFTSIFLASQGFACFAADLPGHGRSPGRRAFVPKVNLLLADLKDFFQSVRSRPENQGLKSFLFGESMGGALCLLMLLSMPADAWAGAVLVAPLCKISNRIKPPRPVQMALRFVAMFAPTLAVIDFADLVEKSVKVPEKRVLAMSNPMRYNGKMRVGTMLKLLRISDELGSRLHEVSIPFLVLHGSADEVLDPADSMALYEEARSEDKTIKIYDGMLHLLLFGEPDKNVAMVRRDILNWLNERCPNQHEIHIERM